MNLILPNRLLFFVALFTVMTGVTLELDGQDRFNLFHLTGNRNSSAIDENAETAITSNLSIPIVFKDSSVWFSSIDYQYFDIGNTPSLGVPNDRIRLNGFIFRTGYIHRMSKNRSLQLLAIPRLMTDFKVAFSSALQFGGIALFEKKRDANLTWRLGALYNSEFFGPQLVPLVYLDWRVAPRWKVKGLFPIFGTFYREMSPTTSVGIHFVGLTTSYKNSLLDATRTYVERRVIDVSVFARFALWKALFLEGRIGYSVTKDYGIFAEGDQLDLAIPLVNFGDNRTRLNEETNGTTPFALIRLLYSIQTD